MQPGSSSEEDVELCGLRADGLRGGGQRQSREHLHPQELYDVPA